MSFGLEMHHPHIHEAIKTAYSKDIILFAAASNGGNCGVTYPAKYHEVICVFSTDGMGNASACNPTETRKPGYQFATLGEAVKSAWPTMLDKEKGAPRRRKTGTSFATPIAAGVAACVLEFALMNDLDDGLYGVLKQHQGMVEILAKHLSVKRGKLHYIQPWQLFSKDRQADSILFMLKESLKSLRW